jgi:hypothetical protein
MVWHPRAKRAPSIQIELPLTGRRFQSLGAAATLSAEDQARVARYCANKAALDATFDELIQYRRLDSVRPAVAYKAFNM